MSRFAPFGLLSLCYLFFVQANVLAEVTVAPSERGAVVKIDGHLFAEYLKQAGTSPSVWPIVGPTGKKMTRTFPFGPKDQDGSDDHPHHQSMWFTHDEVSGPHVERADFWEGNRNDRSGGNGPRVVHREFVKQESDGKTATIVTRNDWMSGDQRLLEDERRLVFGTRANGDRWIDFTITIKATDGDFTFGDTKEGTFGVRVPDSMRVIAKQGGRIVNSDGVEDDAAWGIPARWVDYTGPVDGETLGIAIFSHPKSFRPIPRWHVRGYGLFAANPFGQKDFPKPELAQQGAYTLKKGDELTLRYRVLLHRGTTDEADVAAAYEEFAALP